jgi:hypothetical protein
MIAGLQPLHVLPHPFNHARPLMAQHNGRMGHAGSGITFKRFFYRFSLALPLEEIEADIRTGPSSRKWLACWHT